MSSNSKLTQKCEALFADFIKGSEAEEVGRDQICVGQSDEPGEISHDRGSKFPHGNNNLTALRPIGGRGSRETRSSKDTMGAGAAWAYAAPAGSPKVLAWYGSGRQGLVRWYLLTMWATISMNAAG